MASLNVTCDVMKMAVLLGPPRALFLIVWLLGPRLSEETEFVPASHTVESEVQNPSNQSTGMLVRPEAAAILQLDVADWRATNPKPDTLYMLGNVPVYQPATDFLSASQVRQWKNYYINFLLGSARWRKEYMDKRVKEVTLDETYKRPALRGQLSVFTKAFVTKGTILGAYSGMVIKLGGDGDNGASFDLRAEIDYLNTFYPGHVTHESIRRYAFSVPLTVFRQPGVDPNTLMVSGLLRGNAIVNVNSYWAPPETDQSNLNDFNTDTAFIRMNDLMPIVVYYAKRDIAWGEELMTTYGPGYWYSHQPNYATLRSNMNPVFRWWQDVADPLLLWRFPMERAIECADDVQLLNQLADAKALCYVNRGEPMVAIMNAKLARTIMARNLKQCPSRRLCPKPPVCIFKTPSSHVLTFDLEDMPCCATPSVRAKRGLVKVERGVPKSADTALNSELLH